MTNLTKVNSQISLHPYKGHLKNDWDMVLDQSINGTFLHRREFMEYHGDRFQDASILIYMGDHPIAIFPAEIDKGKVYSHRGLTYAGWILKQGLDKKCTRDLVKRTLDFYRNKGLCIYEIRTVPDFFCSGSQIILNQVMIEEGANEFFSAVHHYSALPNFIHNKGKLWGKRKAIEYKVSIKVSNDYTVFWNEILIPNLDKRHQVKPTHSLQEIAYLAKLFPENIKLFEVRYKGELVGGSVLFLTGLTVHGQYIAANDQGRKIKALDYLMAFFLEVAFPGHAFFNMGVSHIPKTYKINKGLMWWKESFGAKPFSQPFLRFES